MHRRGVGAGAIAKKKLAEASIPTLLDICIFCKVGLALMSCSSLFIQAKYKERGTVIAEDQIAQVTDFKTLKRP